MWGVFCPERGPRGARSGDPVSWLPLGSYTEGVGSGYGIEVNGALNECGRTGSFGVWGGGWCWGKQLVGEPLMVCRFKEERPMQGRCGGLRKGVWKVGSQLGHLGTESQEETLAFNDYFLSLTLP